VACRTMGKVAPNKGQGMMIENTNNRFGELPALRLCELHNAHHGSSPVAHVLATLARPLLFAGTAASNTPIWLAWITCFGDETNLEDCRRMYYSNTLGCSHRWGDGLQGRDAELPGLAC